MNLEHFKAKLEAELARLENELKTVGRINPDNSKDWQPTPGEKSVDTSDPTEFADSIEEYEERTGILKELETQYNDVKDALKKIEDGTYGICEVSGKPIEEDRLEVNPAARTCKDHM